VFFVSRSSVRKGRSAMGHIFCTVGKGLYNVTKIDRASGLDTVSSSNCRAFLNANVP